VGGSSMSDGGRLEKPRRRSKAHATRQSGNAPGVGHYNLRSDSMYTSLGTVEQYGQYPINYRVILPVITSTILLTLAACLLAAAKRQLIAMLTKCNSTVPGSMPSSIRPTVILIQQLSESILIVSVVPVTAL